MKDTDGNVKVEDKWLEGSRRFKRRRKTRIVNLLTLVTLRRVGQMLSAHDSQLNI